MVCVLKRNPLSIAIIIALAAGVAAHSQEIFSAEKFFDGVSAQYGKVTDYTAGVSVFVGKSAVYRGRLSYKTPLFLRIDFDDPKGQVWVFDNEKLVIYMPAPAEVVLVQKFRKRGNTELASMATKQGLNTLRANYGIAFVSSPGPVALDEDSKEQVVKLKLTAKSSGSPFNEIVLSIGQDNLIRRVEGSRAGADKVSMDLTNVKINQNVPDARFKFDPPPYANVLEDFLFDSSG
jgi:outer membrane lipoprotein-sorting protein